MWVRGLKRRWSDLTTERLYVAPYVGAWIETSVEADSIWQTYVAPYVGAWIETAFASILVRDASGRTLCGCVD